MMKLPRSRLHWVLVWGTAAGLAGIPTEMAAQSGPGQPRGQLGAWMAEARASSLHASIQAGGMANPAADQPGQAGPWAPHRVPGMHGGPDSVVSAGKIFVYTLIGAMIPLAPATIYWLRSDETTGNGEDLRFLFGGAATLITVPMAAGFAGADSFGRAMLGTGVGLVLGIVATSLVNRLRAPGVGPSMALGPTAFALTMAGVTTFAITVYEGK